MVKIDSGFCCSLLDKQKILTSLDPTDKKNFCEIPYNELHKISCFSCIEATDFWLCLNYLFYGNYQTINILIHQQY